MIRGLQLILCQRVYCELAHATRCCYSRIMHPTLLLRVCVHSEQHCGAKILCCASLKHTIRAYAYTFEFVHQYPGVATPSTPSLTRALRTGAAEFFQRASRGPWIDELGAYRITSFLCKHACTPGNHAFMCFKVCMECSA